uniref:Uncharacterized protein n=1 Tax=Tanacetum cinerariifolium TaxID=118510 RepID=A0A6L2MCF0_TANCI|nr:hypothetical protein [Tanacetum cinerariifolium]
MRNVTLSYSISFLCAFVRKFSLTISFFIIENANPPPTNNPPVLPTALRAKVVQELNKLKEISTYIDSCLENIYQFLNGFTQPSNEIDMVDLEQDDESVDTPLVSPFLDSDDDSDNGEVLNEQEEYGNEGQLCHKREIFQEKFSECVEMASGFAPDGVAPPDL